MSPSELVNELDIYFRKFDEIIINNNLEKIKTIFSKLHEDLQYDYKQELEKLGIDA